MHRIAKRKTAGRKPALAASRIRREIVANGERLAAARAEVSRLEEVSAKLRSALAQTAGLIFEAPAGR